MTIDPHADPTPSSAQHQQEPVVETSALIAAIREAIGPLPSAEAPCHVGLRAQSECGFCSRIVAAHDAATTLAARLNVAQELKKELSSTVSELASRLSALEAERIELWAVVDQWGKVIRVNGNDAVFITEREAATERDECVAASKRSGTDELLTICRLVGLRPDEEIVRSDRWADVEQLHAVQAENRRLRLQQQSQHPAGARSADDSGYVVALTSFDGPDPKHVFRDLRVVQVPNNWPIGTRVLVTVIPSDAARPHE
jgi:hypothetical protein